MDTIGKGILLAVGVVVGLFIMQRLFGMGI